MVISSFKPLLIVYLLEDGGQRRSRCWSLEFWLFWWFLDWIYLFI